MNVSLQLSNGWTYFVVTWPDLRTWEAVPQAEVLGVDGAGCVGQDAQDDGRAGQDLVPEQENKMEVGA